MPQVASPWPAPSSKTGFIVGRMPRLRRRCATAVPNVCHFDHTPWKYAIDDSKQGDHGASVAGERSDHRSSEFRQPFEQPEPANDAAEDRVVDFIEIFLCLRKKDDLQRRARCLRYASRATCLPACDSVDAF